MSLLTKPMASVAATICVLGLAVGGTNWLLGSNQPAHKSAPSLNSAVSPKLAPPTESPSLLAEENLIALASADTPATSAAQPPAAASETNIPDDEGRVWHFHERSFATEKIEAELRKQTDVDFQDAPLTDVMTFLSDFHNIPIIIDHEALTEAKIKTDTPITRTLTGGKLESALNIILTPLKLDYVIDNDVMMVTTAKQAEATTEAVVYDLTRIPNVEPKTLSSIIMSVTKPEAWSEKGGPGTLVFGTDFIAINQNQRTHRKIVSLLNQLERLAKEQARRRAAKPASR